MDLTKDRAREILTGFRDKRILVIGDLMLDEYIWGNVNRISPEAPVMVVDAVRYSQVPGGAANVVNNICALGAKTTVAGVIGEDEYGSVLKAALEDEGADTSGLVATSDRPTTRKTRVIAHSQQVLRVDHERRNSLPEPAAERLNRLIEKLAAEADAILLSDYQKGVVSSSLLRQCVKLGGNKPLTGNLKPNAIGPDAALTCLTLNLSEAQAAVGIGPFNSDSDIFSAGKILLRRTGSAHVLITRGADGLTLFSALAPDYPTHIAARPVAVYDVAGAGDTVISALTLALAGGASPVEAVTLANYAAAEVVKKVGVSTVSPEELLDAIV